MGVEQRKYPLRSIAARHPVALPLMAAWRYDAEAAPGGSAGAWLLGEFLNPKEWTS